MDLLEPFDGRGRSPASTGQGDPLALTEDSGPSLADLVPTLSCWADVDLDAIATNVRSLRAWIGPSTRLAGVVKAQGYGMGAAEVAHAVLSAGGDRVAVARVHEGAELRAAGVRSPILVLSRTDPTEADQVVRHELTPTIDSEDLARALSVAATRAGTQIPVHLKVDTGLHRFGVEPERALPLARFLSDAPGLRIEGLWTHFANADEKDLSSAHEQLRVFNRVTQELVDAGYRFPIRHAANSAATVAIPAAHLDLVRVGQALYGVHPFDFPADGPDLQMAATLKARVARVMNLAPGDAVGYGETWRATKPVRAATLSAGYADGFPRDLTNRGRVYIRGHEAPILGRVMMDHLVVDITSAGNVVPGDEATLFGYDGQADLSIDIWQVAHDAGTIPHDILTGIGGRVPRVYRQGGRVTRIARLGSPSELFALD
jgi:alanine racemase